MIVIEDKDLPITVAEKIINGRKDYIDPVTKAVAAVGFVFSNGRSPTNEELEGIKQDLFTDDEIEEIAEYLMVYVKRRKEENDGQYRESTGTRQED